MKAELNKIDNGSHINLGYRLTPKYWGHGYATEAAKAWIDYAFQDEESPNRLRLGGKG